MPFLLQFSLIRPVLGSQMSLSPPAICGSKAVPRVEEENARDRLIHWTHTSPWNASKHFEGAHWYHCKAILYHL